MKTCYIVGAGEFYGSICPDSCDLVIAADGGYAELARHGVRCDLLIGDFDSLGDMPVGVETIRHPVKKDDTDTFLAYREGVKRGYTDFEIYGGLGGYEDHSFANLCLLLYAKRQGHEARLIGKHTVASVILNEACRISGERGERLSVFAFGGDAAGVSISGAEYCCQNITLTPDFPLGVSNSFTDEDVHISVERGALLIIREVQSLPPNRR